MKTTLPVTITTAIASQRAAWKTAKAAAAELAAFTQESERKLCGCARGTDTAGDIAKLAQKNAENSAFRAEYATLAGAKAAELAKKAEVTAEAAYHLMRADTARPLNEAVVTVRAFRVRRRTTSIAGDILKWTAPASPWPGTEEQAVDAILHPALFAIQERHRTRNESGFVPGKDIRTRGTHEDRYLDQQTLAPDSAEFLRVLSEQDPTVIEIDVLPSLGGPEDAVSEEKFEAVARFLEGLLVDETNLLQN